MKKAKILVSLLLISLLAFSTIQLISGNFASASVAPAVFCPNNFQQGTDTANEISLSRSTCQYITSMLANHYPSGCYYSYDSDCTVSRYRSILSTLGTYYDQAVVFSKGHRGMPYFYDNPSNTNHLSLLDYSGADVVDHTDIYDRTSSENIVTFIWHCETAERYTSGCTPDAYGPYGMPYCWTHNSGMTAYGDSGTQVFLGWVDGSPQFEHNAEGIYNYAHVAYYFWYYMVNGATVEEALDDVSDVIFSDDTYLQSPLCDWLLVWGDRTTDLP